MSSHIVPYVTRRTPRGDRTVDLYSRLLDDRIVYLASPIDVGVATTVIAQLIHLESDAPDKAISLYVGSPGGSLPAALGIYDAMQYVASPIDTICVGEAGPAAAMLLAAGAPGRRRILPNARVVLHQPSRQGQRGSIPDLIVEADDLAARRRRYDELLARHTGRTVDQVHEDTDRVLSLDAEAAVAYGLVDEVIAPR